MGVGAQRCPLGLHALRGLRAAGVAGNRPRGGWPAAVVGGVWCQALSLPRPPVLWRWRPGFRDPCVPGAVGAGVGAQHRFHSVRPCGPALLAVGVAEERPRGGCLPLLRGASEVRHSPSPDCPPSGRAVGVRYPRAVGAGVWVWGPNTVPLACTPCGGCVPRGWWGAVPEGGWPATVVRGVWCQALCLPQPPVLWGGQPGYCDPCVPGAVGAGVGTQHRFHSVRPCGPAMLAVGVAEGRPREGCLPQLGGASEVRRSPSPDCAPTGRAVGVRHPRAVGVGVWVWGPNTVPLACMPCGGCMPRGRCGAVLGGGWPATVVRGVWCQALFLPRPPFLWGRQPGFRDPCVLGAVGAGVMTQHRPHSVRPCGPALLAVGVAEGHPRGGCLPPV